MENQTNRIQLSNKLYWIYLIGLFLILFLPLLVLPPWFTHIGWGKTIVFRIILSLLLFLFIWQILFKKIDLSYIKEKIKSVSLSFWLLIALFGVYLLATIFSLDPHFSLWGDPFRSGGFVSFAFYIFLAILTFLIIQKKDWQKIWDLSIIIGILVSIVAIFQQFGIYSKFFIPFTVRPGSTMGNPIMLALYLLLLTFISLSFFIKSKNVAKKTFYLISLLLFLFVSLFLAQTRGALIGLAIGFLWFLFAYPNKIKRLKIIFAIILVFVLFGMHSAKIYLDSHLYLYQKMPPIISSTLDRTLSIFETTKIMESRISAWKVSWNALKERPILGWGPENFVIGFDKHYDPRLPRLAQGPGGAEWWDRAHNFVFEISITAGIPALIIYLSLFGVLIWQLQKAKSRRPEEAIISNGLQATFIGYLVANLFSIDSFDTYLLSFLLIGCSFHLISAANLKSESGYPGNKKREKDKIYKYNKIIISLLFIFLVWFIWSFNWQPLYANKELNMAIFYAEEAKIKNCQKALGIVDKIPSFPTIIDNYIRVLSAAEVIQNCTDESSAEILAEKAIQLLKKNVETHPNFTQNWLLLAEYTNVLIAEKIKLTENVFVPTEEMVQLKNEADYYFEQASKLSPKRQEVYKEWLKTDLITGEYEIAQEKAKKCIDVNPNFGGCYWLMALTQGYLKNPEQFNYYSALAKEKGYNTESEEALQQLINMYIRTGNYQALTEAFPKLIEITENKQQKAQLHASLAAVYIELGQIENARKEALKILELIPFFPPELQTRARADVEAFLRSLSE